MKLFFSICCTLLLTSAVFAQSEKHQVIDKTAFQNALQQKNIQLVDVRRPEEFEAGKIGDAQNINVLEPETFLEEINKLNKEQPVYIYCRSGNRSNKAALLMLAEGFTKVYDLEGGYLNWTAKDTEEE